MELPPSIVSLWFVFWEVLTPFFVYFNLYRIWIARFCIKCSNQNGPTYHKKSILNQLSVLWLIRLGSYMNIIRSRSKTKIGFITLKTQTSAFSLLISNQLSSLWINHELRYLCLPFHANEHNTQTQATRDQTNDPDFVNIITSDIGVMLLND